MSVETVFSGIDFIPHALGWKIGMLISYPIYLVRFILKPKSNLFFLNEQAINRVSEFLVNHSLTHVSFQEPGRTVWKIGQPKTGMKM